MVRIVSDTSTLYSSAQARQAGFAVTPLSVTIGGNSYLEFDEIDAQAFVDLINQGNMPTSSQPAVGSVAAQYEQYEEDEILNISMADGLSGTYQSACGAREMVDNKDNITVINSRTLCGPHRYMVTEAQKMKEAGKSAKEIIDWVTQKSFETDSWLIPQDFGFLRRGGRMTPTAAAIGSVLKLKPVLCLTEDCKRLDKFAIKRTFSGAVKAILDSLKDKPFGSDYIFYVVHARAFKDCETAVELIKQYFPEVTIETYELSHAFITQGGPACVAIQYIKK